MKPRLLLELSRVQAGYGLAPVLHDFNLGVHEGEIVSILGRNGVGKTTLLRTIVGAIRPQRGEVRLRGRSIGDLPVHERARGGIAYVPQGREIFPSLSVLDNLRAAAFGVGRADADQAVEGLFDEFPVLRDKRAARGGSLSGGQQQILALARALMTRPSLLLLDEPSEGIQPSIVDQIANKVRELNRREGIAAIVVEQNLDFIARMGAHCHLVDKGRIVFDCPADRIVRDPELQRQYLGV